MEQFLILSHVVSGGIVLFLGLINLLNRKGQKNHIIIGKVYVGSMWWICISAVSIIAFYRFSFFLMVIAVISFYTSFVGVRVLRRKKLGSESWYDWLAAIATSLFGVALLGYAVFLFSRTSHTMLASLCIVFGILTFNNGFRDIKFFLKPGMPEKKWWLYQHIGAISGSYIAAVTAFVVQNGRTFFPTWDHQWLFWVLPGVIGTPLITLTIKKYQKMNAASS